MEIDLAEVQKKIEARQEGFGQTSPERKLARPFMSRLWLRLTELYGHRFTSSFGVDVDPDDVWAKALFGLTGEDIAKGLGECVARGLEWPPSAPAFRALCVEPYSATHQGEAYKPFPALPPPDKSEDTDRIARETLARLKAMFNTPEASHVSEP